MSEQVERQLALMAHLLREVIEAQMQMSLVLAGAFDPSRPVPDLLTGRVSERLKRMAAILEEAQDDRLPSELAASLYANALRLQGLRNRGPGY